MTKKSSVVVLSSMIDKLTYLFMQLQNSLHPIIIEQEKSITKHCVNLGKMCLRIFQRRALELALTTRALNRHVALASTLMRKYKI